MASQNWKEGPLDDRTKRGFVRLLGELQRLEQEEQMLAKFERARKSLDELDRLIARLERLGKTLERAPKNDS